MNSLGFNDVNMPEQENSLDTYITRVMGDQRELYTYILAQVPSLSDADDILQEVNLVLWGKRDEFSAAENYRAVMLHVARIQIMAFYKRKGRNRLRGFDEELLGILSAEAEERQDGLEAKRQALADCLRSLSDRDRRTIQDRYYRGLSGGELAAKLGRTADSVYHTLHRIRNLLIACVRRRLSAEEGA